LHGIAERVQGFLFFIPRYSFAVVSLTGTPKVILDKTMPAVTFFVPAKHGAEVQTQTKYKQKNSRQQHLLNIVIFLSFSLRCS